MNNIISSNLHGDCFDQHSSPVTMSYSNKTTMPACNRLLERKWDSKKLQSHHDRLRSVRPTIDSSSPKEYLHIRQNLRKVQIENDKQAIIDSHNHKLLSKMNQIMHTTGRVDHRNMDWKPKRSLNFVKKQQEIDRLMQDNLAMLKRIQYTKPLYNTSAWESDYRRHKSLIKNISILPPIPRSKSLSEPARPLCDPVRLPSLTDKRMKSDRPETDQSEIHEEIDVDLPELNVMT